MKNFSFFKNVRDKPQLPKNSKPGVYYIPTGCNKGYTGESKKKISTRINEHDTAVFNVDGKNDALSASR